MAEKVFGSGESSGIRMKVSSDGNSVRRAACVTLFEKHSGCNRNAKQLLPLLQDFLAVSEDFLTYFTIDII